MFASINTISLVPGVIQMHPIDRYINTERQCRWLHSEPLHSLLSGAFNSPHKAASSGQ